MKPIGPLPPEFADQRDTLAIAGRPYGDWIAYAGATPLFVYDFAMIAARVVRLRAAFPGIDIHYAIKANPFAPLIAAIGGIVDGLDIASGGELAVVRDVKPSSAISFAGPGKTDAELAAAVSAGVTINLESEGEADRALAIAERAGTIPRLAIRVNPDFELRGSGMRMGGRASPFGIDVERAAPLAGRVIAAGADWRGWHVFAGSQTLDTAAIVEAQAATLALVGRLSEAVGASPPLVNLGGGFGIPYFASDRSIDVESVGAALHDAMASRAEVLAGSRFALELGRWLVGEAGVYLTRIVDAKASRGTRFLVTDGGLHHQLAATGNLGTVVRRNYPVAVASRMGEAAVAPVVVSGCLCTPLDRLADDCALPPADVGDVIAVFCAGAYGLSASPTAFLGHPPPVQILAGSPDNPNAIFTC